LGGGGGDPPAANTEKKKLAYGRVNGAFREQGLGDQGPRCLRRRAFVPGGPTRWGPTELEKTDTKWDRLETKDFLSSHGRTQCQEGKGTACRRDGRKDW